MTYATSLRAAALALGVLTAAPPRPGPPGPPETAAVSYWLWAGVSPPPATATAETVFAHQGHFRLTRAGALHFERLGLDPYPAGFSRLVLVFRLAALAAPELCARDAARRSERWEARGQPVAGVQLDFDAGTLALGRYAQFLRAFRAALPRRYALSVTGLADWGANAPAADLAALAGVVDDVAFQLYRGRAPVAGWERYAASLARSPLPFRVGLLPGMALSPQLRARLAATPAFRGVVFFLSKGRGA